MPVLRKNFVRVTNARMSVQNVVFLFSTVRTIWLIATVLCDSELPCSCPTLLVGLSFAPAWLPSRNCLARGDAEFKYRYIIMPMRIWNPLVRDRSPGHLLKRIIGLCAALSLAWCGNSAAQTASVKLDQLANRFVQQALNYDPTISYFTGLPTKDHSRFPDRTPAALAAFDAEEMSDLKELRAIDPHGLPASSRATYANLKEQLESDLQLRVCKVELWNVNHFSGWPSNFAEIAEQQPVASADDRAQALRRWGSVPHYLDVEIANLKRGLAEGYAAPKSVVRRVVAQLDSFTSVPPEKSPFYSPAERSKDAAFKSAFAKLIEEQINPALKCYRDYLQNEYLPKAREEVAVSDLPDGAACYQAFLRQSTTLTRTPQEVFDLGQKTVAANQADVAKLGKEMFGTTDFATIVKDVKARPEDHFQSKEELLAYSRTVLANAKAKTAAKLIDQMPKQDVVIEPERDFEDAAGVSSHYEPEPDTSKPATYRIELGNWQSQTRGEAEITVVHEAWPGHHLQIALARELLPDSPLSKLIINSAYVEGWARYAEAMAEEAGIYDNKGALIQRRVLPARGMVVDPGLHAFHWTRQQAIDYLIASGHFTAKSAADAVDRIAVLPGQLTSYDSGGLEITTLRQEAQSKLGNHFDLRKFNRTVLEEGVVPLSELRVHVEDWIATQSAGNQPTVNVSK
jgi:uncharacterized protein (DUF885 family)